MKKVLLVGTGNMSREYAKVLGSSLTQICGRNKDNLEKFSSEFNIKSIITIDEMSNLHLFDYIIIATSCDSLYEVSKKLILNGARNLLIEKPVALYSYQIMDLIKLKNEFKVNIKVALNRRYYQSVIKMKDIFSFQKPIFATFDFTEWLDNIPANLKTGITGQKWGLANSIHVFDTISYLLGSCKIISKSISGENTLAWHKTSSTFSGHCLFGEVNTTYATSWLTPGRWNIEVSTFENRFKLSPMEKLQFLELNSVNWKEYELDYSVDNIYKPGLFNMIKAYENEVYHFQRSELPSLEEYLITYNAFSEILGYLND